MKFEQFLSDGTVDKNAVLQILELLKDKSFHDATLTLKTVEYLIKSNVYLDYAKAREHLQRVIHND